MSDDKELLEIVAELEQEGIVHPSKRLAVAKKRLKMRKAWRDVAKRSVPLVKALSNAGVEVESVWDLIGTEYDYKSIIPLLLEHLEKPYPTRTREGIVRALSVPEANALFTKRLIEIFRSEQDELIKSTIGGVLAYSGDPHEIDEMVSLLEDPSHGDARFFLPHAVARILKKDAIPILMPLLDQAGFGAQVIDALGRVKAAEALPAIRKYTEHEDGYIRTHAKAALRRIEKSLATAAAGPAKTHTAGGAGAAVATVDRTDSSRIRAVPRAQHIHEASTSLDLEAVDVLLARLNDRLELGVDVEELYGFTLDTEVEQERALALRTSFRGTSVEFEYRVFMDDVDCAGIFFFSQNKDLIDAVKLEFDQYFEDEGL